MPTAHKILMCIGKRKYRTFIPKKGCSNYNTPTIRSLQNWENKKSTAVGFIKNVKMCLNKVTRCN